MENQPEETPLAFLVATILVVAAVACWQWVRTPVVLFTWPSERCVSVEFGGTCERLPYQYRIRWVSEEYECQKNC